MRAVPPPPAFSGGGPSHFICAPSARYVHRAEVYTTVVIAWVLLIAKLIVFVCQEFQRPGNGPKDERLLTIWCTLHRVTSITTICTHCLDQCHICKQHIRIIGVPTTWHATGFPHIICSASTVWILSILHHQQPPPPACPSPGKLL